MSPITEEGKSSGSSASNLGSSTSKGPLVIRRKYKAPVFYFQNTIRSQGNCGPGYDKSGYKQYLTNKDNQNRYRVTVVSTWINSQTGALESYTKIYTSEAGGEIYLGCDYQHMAGNGDTRITRKITREVRIGN